MATLSGVVIKGVASALPAAGSAGRVYHTTDTLRILYDDGTVWDDITPITRPAATLYATPPAGGNFQIPHGLSSTPSHIVITMTAPGGIWQQAPPDATNVYLAASDGTVTATIYVFA